MQSSKVLNTSHTAFNDLLTNSIQKGQSLLSRNHIVDDYDENVRKDIYGSQQFSGKKSARENQLESRYRQPSKSPLKSYINSKIDTHIERLKGSKAPVETKPHNGFEDIAHSAEHKDILFESVVQSNENPFALKDDGAADHNVEFKAQKDAEHQHQMIKISGNYDWNQNKYQEGQKNENLTRSRDELSRSHEKFRPTLSKVTIDHHDSPKRASQLIDRTEHDIHHGDDVAASSLRRSANRGEHTDDGHPDEDHWIKTSRTIDRLYQKHSDLEKTRISQGAATAEELARAKEEDVTQNRSYRYAVETQHGSPQKTLIETLRLRSLEDMSVAQVEPHETVVNTSNSQLVNRYHALKQQHIKISKQALKFSASRINPPRCLLDVLDALFSLIYGVYEKVEHDYFSAKEKKYYEYKAYFQNVEELTDVLAHLKLYIETQGLPIRNVIQADKALCRYNKTVKRVEAKPYLDTTEEISKFVLFFLEYYNILRVSSSLTRN
jgi:hypothetical protein